MIPETTCRIPAHRRDELVDALCAVVTELVDDERPAGALTPHLDRAVARWSEDVPAPADVLALVAQVRARTRADRSRRHAEVLQRAELVGVAAVAARHVREALTDPLTGLATRARLEQEVQHLVASCARAGTPLTAVILDVDGLKRINDEQGHVAGDAAIAEAGHAIRAHLRTADRGFRYGGDEFALFLPGTTQDGARVLVERIRSSCPTSLSAGIAVHSGDAHDTDVATWLSAADAELYGRRREERGTAVHVPRPRRPRSVLLATAAAAVGTAVGVGLAVPVAMHAVSGRDAPAVRRAPSHAAPAGGSARPAPVPAVTRIPVRQAPVSRPAAPAVTRPLAPTLPVPAVVVLPSEAPRLPVLPTLVPTPLPSPSSSPGLVGGVVDGVGQLLAALL